MTSIEHCSCLALRQAARHISRLYDAALAPVELSLNQFSILSKLSTLGAQNLQDLADILVMDRSTLGRLVQPLATRGLVVAERGLSDRRQRLVSITAEGIRMVGKARPLWRQAEHGFANLFGRTDTKRLREALIKVAHLDAAQLREGMERGT